MSTPPVIALILAGGSGTRFWPASRPAKPKQLLALTGRQPMLVETAERVLPLVAGWDAVFVAVGHATEHATRALLPELPGVNLLVEPAPRNTAPCIAWAAAVAARRDPESVLVVLPSDHHVEDVAAFRRALAVAIDSARGGTITTLGVRPTRPETGFGYIEVAHAEGTVTVANRFVEKPPLALAEAFVNGGRHLWNAGMFVFRARDMVDAVHAHLPDVGAFIDRIDAAAGAGREAVELAALFPALPSVSVDVGVMEKLERLAVVPLDCGWSDVGSWQAAWELADKDGDGNAGGAQLVAIDARNNYVVDVTGAASPQRKKVVALLGVSDLVIVETDDALLVVPRARSQEVRAFAERIASRGERS